MAPSSTKWQTRTVTPFLTADILADVPLDVAGSASAGSLIAGDTPVRVGLYWGAGQDLVRWRANLGQLAGARFGEESGGNVCGQIARRLEVTVPGHEAHYTGPAGSGASHTPSEVIVLYAFHAGGTPVVALYAVAAAERAAHQGDELAFLASIKCQP